MKSRVENVKGNWYRLLSMSIILSIVLLMFLATGNTPTAAAAPDTPGMTFQNVSAEGMHKISMTEIRNFEVVLPLKSGTDADALASTVTWSLVRSEGMFDKAEFPFQYLGNTLQNWETGTNKRKVFADIQTVAATKSGNPALKLTFRNITFLNTTTTSSNRNAWLDYVGDFQLVCKDGNTVLGSKTVRVNPYDSFRSVEEFSLELAQAKLAAEAAGLYAQVYSMGQSTEGRDMPYIVLAKDKAAVENWKSFLAKAVKDPEAAKTYYNANKASIKIPVLYSNVHADENVGADAPMDFVWDVIKSASNPISYRNIDALTAAGQTRLTEQRALTRSSSYGPTGNRVTPELVKDWVTFRGGITPNNTNDTSGAIDDATMASYYDINYKNFNSKEILEDVFFVVVPEENVDGRAHNTRTGGGGIDLNRDNLFQTQAETQNMTAMIAEWNPAAFIEFHGFVSNFQLEPCSPPHEPNVEYDLFAEMGIKGGEAFGASAVVNNKLYNSYQIPLRDYLTTKDGKPYWAAPWDDMSTNYTPQYSMLHGTVAYTVEVPGSNEEGKKALEYGMFGHSTQVAEDKDSYVENLMAAFARQVKNEDPASVRDWYVDINDNTAAEADIYRPRSTENNNFFPEYYIIPVDGENQRGISEAYNMKDFLLRNKVVVSKLTEAVTYKGVTYKAGSLVVNMSQAKRNVANAALYDSVLITSWTDLYSEPTTSFDKTRGFDSIEVRQKGLLTGKLTEVTQTGGATVFDGTKGDAVVIANNSVAAIKGINTLLSAGKTVGYITEGEYKGNFTVSYEDFLTVKDSIVLQAYGVKESPVAVKVKNPKLYLTGKPLANTNGYVKYAEKYSAYEYNYSRMAFIDEMGFTVTDDVTKADVIIAIANTQTWERVAVNAAIKTGKPVFTTTTLTDVTFDGKSAVEQFGLTNPSSGLTDCLTTVTYPSGSPVTDSYVYADDYIMYGYGGKYFTKVPENAKVLVQNTYDTPFGGFIKQQDLDNFKGKAVAISYTGNGMDYTAFANTLVRKLHAKDDYRYATNTVFSKMLGDAVVIPVVEEKPESSTPSTPTELDSSSAVSSVQPVSSGSSSLTTSTGNPKTSDNTFSAGAVIILMVSFSTAVLLYKRKSDKSEK